MPNLNIVALFLVITSMAGGVMTDDKTNNTLVSFGQFIKINPAQRLQNFDNGMSKAYDAYDDRNKSKKYIAIVCGIEAFPRWAAAAAYEKLNDTSFLRLIGSGVVRWPTDNKQKYVFMYHGGVANPLMKQNGETNFDWRHPDITSLLITPMASMLKEMKGHGFSHGSIRPTNIYHGSADKNKPIILGDCLSVHQHSAQPSLYLPITKALADPMGRGYGSISDDIYAFGVTLAALLRRNNHLAGVSDEGIVKRKMESGSYTTIIGSERFQPTFLELLRGLLQDDVETRWTVDDIFAWLDGVRLTPPVMKARKKANRPMIIDGNKHLHLDHLALDIQKNPSETLRIVENGELSQWLQKSLGDKSLYVDYQNALDRVTSLGSMSQNKEYLATQISMVLYPMMPISFKGRCFTYDGVGGLLAKAALENENLDYYKQVLALNLPDYSASLANLTTSEMSVNMKMFHASRAALRNNKLGFGIEKCIYTLFNTAPCLSPKLKDFFVYSERSALLSYETLCKSGKEIALLLDQHAICFFSIHSNSMIEKCFHDLNAPEKDRQVLGNLRFLAMIQRRLKSGPMPATANVILGALSGVYKTFNNLAMRKKLEEGVNEAAKKGDLVGMAALLDDETTKARDAKAFDIAKRQYKLLQDEYNRYNVKLANKRTYGVTNGKDVASVVAWSISTAITVMTVFAFLSGFQIL